MDEEGSLTSLASSARMSSCETRLLAASMAVDAAVAALVRRPSTSEGFLPRVVVVVVKVPLSAEGIARDSMLPLL